MRENIHLLALITSTEYCCDISAVVTILPIPNPDPRPSDVQLSVEGIAEKHKYSMEAAERRLGSISRHVLGLNPCSGIVPSTGGQQLQGQVAIITGQRSSWIQ